MSRRGSKTSRGCWRRGHSLDTLPGHGRDAQRGDHPSCQPHVHVCEPENPDGTDGNGEAVQRRGQLLANICICSSLSHRSGKCTSGTTARPLAHSCSAITTGQLKSFPLEAPQSIRRWKRSHSARSSEFLIFQCIRSTRTMEGRRRPGLKLQELGARVVGPSGNDGFRQTVAVQQSNPKAS